MKQILGIILITAILFSQSNELKQGTGTGTGLHYPVSGGTAFSFGSSGLSRNITVWGAANTNGVGIGASANSPTIQLVEDNGHLNTKNWSADKDFIVTLRPGGTMTEVLRVKANGNVGIGTTNPGFLFNVEKSVNSNYIAKIVNTSGTGGQGLSVETTDGNGVGDAFKVVTFRSVSPKNMIRVTNHPGNVLLAENGGNVGIGTTSPSFPLVVKKNVSNLMFNEGLLNATPNLVVYSSNAKAIGLAAGTIGAGLTFDNSGSFNISSTSKSTIVNGQIGNSNIHLTVLPSGKVGIGTSSPAEQLDIIGNIQLTGDLKMWRNAAVKKKIDFGAYSYLESTNRNADNVSAGNYGTMLLRNAHIDNHTTNTYKNPNGYLTAQRIEMRAGKWTFDYRNSTGTSQTWNESEWQNKFTIDGNTGSVGIGTINTHGAKLAVAGDIKANGVITSTKVKVTTSVWPDYVFADDYKLKSLEEIEAHIKAKRHLPGIPSEKEIKEKGLDLGDMQAKMMEKIEELTLHMIEMKKEINQLKVENAKLKMTN